MRVDGSVRMTWPEAECEWKLLWRYEPGAGERFALPSWSFELYDKPRVYTSSDGNDPGRTTNGVAQA